jgi:molybdenum cofactor sulfurtransferase
VSARSATERLPAASRRLAGSFVGYAEVESVCELHHVQLRTGCMCNPGACQAALNLPYASSPPPVESVGHAQRGRDEKVRSNFTESGHVCGDSHDMVDGVPTGAVCVCVCQSFARHV